MKIKQEFLDSPSQLFDLGFEYKEETKWDDLDWELKDVLSYPLGHSRRGQFYYLTIKKDNRDLMIYATKPDGDGTHIEIGDILLKMIGLGMIEE